MILFNGVFDFAKVSNDNITTSAFPALVPTTTEPAGPGVIQWSGPATVTANAYTSPDRDEAPSGALVLLVGQGDAGSSFSHQLTGWQRLGSLWIPVPLLQVDVALGSTVGVAGAPVDASTRFADSLSLTLSASSADIVSPSDGRLAYYLVHPLAFDKLQFTFSLSSATSANALVKRL
jgi:hypothetical protein